MPGRVKEHPERFAWLVVGFAGAKGKRNFLALVQILHHHVQVHLLRDGLARPFGRLVHLHLLEGDAVAAVGGPDIKPVTFILDFPAEELAVEGGQGAWVRTIDNDTRVFSYSHVLNLVCSLLHTGQGAFGAPLGEDVNYGADTCGNYREDQHARE